MAVGFSGAIAQSLLDWFCNNTAGTPPTNLWMKLHTGDPGSAGTANAATETTRKEVTFAAASSTAGTCANDAAVTWTGIAGSQDATHFSLWSASTAGTFLGSGTIVANAYTAGDTYNIAIGSAIIAITVAA